MVHDKLIQQDDEEMEAELLLAADPAVVEDQLFHIDDQLITIDENLEEITDEFLHLDEQGRSYNYEIT